jgi:predicted ATP-dependent endonuclease of OLD family
MIAHDEGARENTQKAFSRLSSGHKIVLLTTACLVDAVVEKSLVILDEPETHLHPPLLAALVRAISSILVQKNGVAIVMTHSPVVLQEIPSSCCWEMQRSGSTVALRMISEQTFGSDINTLMRGVFGLEALNSGFHQLLIKALKDNDGDIDKTIQQFNNGIGMEGLLLLKSYSISEEGR